MNIRALLNSLERAQYFLMMSVLWSLGCASPEKIIYFQDKNTEYTYEDSVANVAILQPGDLVSITVTSLDMEAAQPFNLPVANSTSTNGGSSKGQLGYLIDQEGMIELPVIGSIKLGKLTRQGAIALISKEVKAYLSNPIVNLRLLNFRITVLGEVRRPGTFDIPSEGVTLAQAIGMAGDLSINGIRENILVIRDTAGEKEEFRVDLTSNEILNSPVYYLRQNDIIYVEPNKAKMNSSEVSPTFSIFLSIISLIITTTLVLVTRL